MEDEEVEYDCDWDTAYDTYRDDLLTMDYDELVQKYGKRLADAKLESKSE